MNRYAPHPYRANEMVTHGAGEFVRWADVEALEAARDAYCQAHARAVAERDSLKAKIATLAQDWQQARIREDALKAEVERVSAEYAQHAKDCIALALVDDERETALEAQRDALAADNARLREALTTVLASAFPHPVEHPSMARAWAIAREALEVRDV